MDLYIHSPICLHGVVLNYLSIGTPSPFSLIILIKSNLYVNHTATGCSEDEYILFKFIRMMIFLNLWY
jgi:hypothetical protein